MGEVASEQDAEAAGLEDVERFDALKVLRDVAHAGFRLGIDALDHRAANDAARVEQALALHVGRGRNHLGILHDVGGDAPPVGHGTHAVCDLDVRDDAEHAVADLLLEAVHDGEHDDERGHAERDRCDGHAGDERKEAVLAASPASCSRVGEADGQFKRNFHGLTR